ncbi:MAG: hypothetical protein IJR66_05255 [Clostridia bacterium]|nr:hypothetical protein [Clostridia bacterium]
MLYYDKEDLVKIKKERKKLLAIYFSVLAVYLAVSVFLLIKVILLPYGSKTINLIKLTEYPLSGIFVIFSFIFLGIKYKKTNRFYKLLYGIETGLKNTTVATFLERNEELITKDGVDMKSLIFLEWNKYKGDYFERKVLVFYEKPFPEIPENSEVKFVTQGNVLVSYEIAEEQKDDKKIKTKTKTKTRKDKGDEL